MQNGRQQKMCLRIICAEIRVFSSQCGWKAMLQAPNCGRKPHIGLGFSTCGVEIARLQHLGLCCWPLASECQRIETEKTRLSAEKHLSPWTQYLVSFSNQLRTFRSYCLAEGYQTFVLQSAR